MHRTLFVHPWFCDVARCCCLAAASRERVPSQGIQQTSLNYSIAGVAWESAPPYRGVERARKIGGRSLHVNHLCVHRLDLCEQPFEQEETHSAPVTCSSLRAILQRRAHASAVRVARAAPNSLPQRPLHRHALRRANTPRPSRRRIDCSCPAYGIVHTQIIKFGMWIRWLSRNYKLKNLICAH